MPAPTDRHRRLATELVDMVASAPCVADLEQRVAQLLAAEDAGPTPVYVGRPMPAETTPTDRHWRLAARVADDAVTTGKVARLLADLDAHRVPIEAAAAAYQRGRGDVIRAVRAEIARTAPVESDVAFGLRLLRLLDDLTSPTTDRLAAFRAWIGQRVELDRAAVLTALDTFEKDPAHR